MVATGSKFGRIIEVVYLVEDIEAAMQYWLSEADLGPLSVDMIMTEEA